MKSLNDIYKEKEQLFYWNNLCGEINMPGDGGYSKHEETDLPPQCLNLFKTFFSLDYDVPTYVVSYDGKVGILLVELFSEEDAFSLCSIGPADTAPEKARIEAMRPVLMDMWAYILKQRASHLESNPLLNDCTVMFGDYTDPIGHELCVFIPADETDRLTEIKATFIQECENQMDSQRLLMAAKVLFCQ